MKQQLTPYVAEADELTVAVTGATPLLNALQKLGGSQWARSPMHNRWTSHGTWTHRVSLIRQFDAVPTRAG